MIAQEGASSQVTGLSMLPDLLLFPFTWLLLQESPHFLLGQGRRTEAIQALEYIAHMNNQGEKVEFCVQ